MGADPRPTSRAAAVRARAWRLFLGWPSLGGLAGATLGLSASLTPSLLPRSWLLQGTVSGVALAMGYGLGSGMGAFYRSMVRWKPPRPRWVVGALLPVLGAGIMLWSFSVHHRWQVDVRGLMGMDAAIAHHPLAVAAVALGSGYLLVVVGRLLRAAWRAHLALLGRVMPRGWAWAVGVLLAGILVVLVVDVVVAGRIFPAVNRAALAANARLEAGIDRPTSRHRSGGRDTLVPWETLGRQGRAFVTQGPGLEDLTKFNGAPAVEPIRVYVGLASAGSLAERAELAVAELERTGAFDREVLVVINPTGTGWVDPLAVDPLEYMYMGDTAAVALQYSYLPSWLVMLGNQDRARDAAESLFLAVTNRLQQEPASSRPLLLVYGESLGAFGAESLFSGLDDIGRRTDGVLWVGPPRASRLWQRFTFGRDHGSPIWQPVYRGGETVRFGWDRQSLLKPDGPWRRPRVVYLQHASDPITWWTPGLLLNRPEWMDEPRSPGVSERMPYMPVVTFLQIGVDLAVSTEVPLGHGHKFGPSQAEAWSLIAPPGGWSKGDTERLVAALTE
jgi:uncharacterized membrane protein